MKNSRKIEILQMMIARIDSFYHGICGVLYSLMKEEITEDEYKAMVELLLDNIPTEENKFSIFTQSAYWGTEDYRFSTGYWWVKMGDFPISRQIRKDYLNRLIDTLK